MKSFRPCKPRLRVPFPLNRSQFLPHRLFRAENAQPDIVSLRKELKDAAKQKKLSARLNPSPKNTSDASNWELTVGIEIHAELNTARKLFSSAPATSSTSPGPNSHVALFDLAYPGSQPHFQHATLLPALRAALALNCAVQRKSSWDRKHYFYADQPNGYQITQYYSPFAVNGSITLYPHDGIAPSDYPSVTIGIKQIQMEQDTAKTVLEPPDKYLLDFNRVSHPLIEIITLPHVHHPSTAAALVRKVQSVLKSVDACVAGMEVGGLRADVNVSIRRVNEVGTNAYHGVTGLGTRTEIKNLASFKAVEDAIIAERDRQIRVVETGGVVEGETRGWTLGNSETRKLRGKEGEVDYRYMPDPDLGPLVIANGLVEHLRETMPVLGDEMLARLTGEEYGLSVKDAKTLLELDDGERLEYYFDVVKHLRRHEDGQLPKDAGRVSGNWILHELGALYSKAEAGWSTERVPSAKLAEILRYLLANRITGRSAKRLLELVFNENWNVIQVIEDEDMMIMDIPDEQYVTIAQKLLEENSAMVDAIKKKDQKGKVMWFVGQMLREMGQSAQAERAKEVICQLLEVPNDMGKPKGKDK